ncbi:hypothetical protein [Streptomyces sp. NPDC093984]|uniref:hypothetical protein n=1 Tax=Streptomyces sp. NPDC093984 TaxID=3366052 RepID=UPI0038243E7B
MQELPPSRESGHSPAAAGDSAEFESGEVTGIFEIPPPPRSPFSIDEDEDAPPPRPEPAEPAEGDTSPRRSPVLWDRVVPLAATALTMIGLLTGIVAAVSGKEQQATKPLPSWVWPITVAGSVVLIAFGLWFYSVVQREKLKEAQRGRAALESAADRLRERMELPSLVDFNRVLLDRYHGIATDQATKAYRSSRFAMAIGLVVLVAAFFAGWRLNAQGDRLFVGSVAAVGTAFTAYLSRTYMQTYERALYQLNQYFNQPVLNGYFLNAERIAATLPVERRAQILEMIVADILESGKVMHRNVTAANSEQTSTPKSGRRRGTDQAGSSISAPQSQ